MSRALHTHPLAPQCPRPWAGPAVSVSPPWAPWWVWHSRPRWPQPCTQSAWHDPHNYQSKGEGKRGIQLDRGILSNSPKCAQSFIVVNISWRYGCYHSCLGVAAEILAQQPSQSRVAIRYKVGLLGILLLWDLRKKRFKLMNTKLWY